MQKILGLLLALVLCVGPGVEVHARDHNKAREEMKSGNALPLKQILPGVRSQVPGRVLDAKLKGGKKMRYEITILSRGDVVRKVIVDAQSGRILRVK
ncbi:MAG: PepSY domain-containing protein [Pseudomonadota bacterium]